MGLHFDTSPIANTSTEISINSFLAKSMNDMHFVDGQSHCIYRSLSILFKSSGFRSGFLNFSPNTLNLFSRWNHCTVVKVLLWEPPPLLSNSSTSPTYRNPQNFSLLAQTLWLLLFLCHFQICLFGFIFSLLVWLPSPILSYAVICVHSKVPPQSPKLFISKYFHCP